MKTGRWGLWLALALGLVVATPELAHGQCTPRNDPNVGIGLFYRDAQGLNSAGTTNLSSLVINVQDCGAKATVSQDQTTALQNALNFACNVIPTAGQTVHPAVFIPAGVYAFTTLNIPCSNLRVFGDGLTATQLCSSASASSTMLQVGTMAAPVNDDVFQDFMVSGFCGAFPQGIDIACNRCHFQRVYVTGYTYFGFRFIGAASNGTGGFSTVHECVIQNGQTNGAAGSGSPAILIVTQGGSTGGPDGNSFDHCFINTANGWIKDSIVAGATSLRSSQSFVANRFEGNTASNITAWTGSSDQDRVVANRWENTGSGGVTFTLNNSPVTDPPALLSDNLYPCGSGGCTWTDNSTSAQASRVGETFGPTNNGLTLNETAMGKGVTLAAQTAAIAATTIFGTSTVPGAGVYRISESVILTTAGTAGTITGNVLCNNGTLANTQSTPTLTTTLALGTEVDLNAVCFSGATQNIQYSTTFTGVTGAPQYTIRVRVDYVSP